MPNIGPWKDKQIEIKRAILQQNKEGVQGQVEVQDMEILKLKEDIHITMHLKGWS